MNRLIRPLSLLVVLLGLLASTPVGASGAPVISALDSPGNGNAPLIAYDPATGTTYVAWSVNLTQTTWDVDICVVPSGATACEGGGPTQLSDPEFPGTTLLDGLAVLPTSGEVTITAGLTDTHQSGTVAWKSSAGGGAFLTGTHGLVNNGDPITIIDGAAVSFGDSVPLSSTDLGILGPTPETCADLSALTDSALAAAETPACKQENSVNYDDLGDLDPSGLYFVGTTDDTGSSLAAEPASVAGDDEVVGLGYGNQATTGCAAGGDTGYGVAVEKVGGSGSGTVNAEGLPAYSLLGCSAIDPALGSGGAAGIGELEGDGTANGTNAPQTVDYRPFNATLHTFGAPVVLGTTAAETDDSTPAGFTFGNTALTEDSGDGVYAIWDTSLNLYLDYSSNGGASWGPPTVIPPPTGLPEGSGPGDAEIVGTGGAGGNVELAYTDGTEQGPDQAQVFLESLNYAALVAANDAVTVSTVQFAGNTSGSSLTVPAGTVDEADLATLSGTNAASATGIIAYDLYSSPSCTPASEVFNGGSQTVTGGVALPSNPVTTALASGTYYWQASYGGDANDSAAVSPCGAEVLTISPATGPGGVGSSPGPTTTTAKPLKPTLSGPSLSGLGTGRPRLSFSDTRAKGGSKISSIIITLPKGLDFIKGGLKKGVSVSGAKIRTETLKGAKLTITFASAATKIKLTISPKALADTRTLRSEIKRHKLTSLTVGVLTRAGKTLTALKLKFKKLA